MELISLPDRRGYDDRPVPLAEPFSTEGHRLTGTEPREFPEHQGGREIRSEPVRPRMTWRPGERGPAHPGADRCDARPTAGRPGRRASQCAAAAIGPRRARRLTFPGFAAKRVEACGT